jgi:hypothetical protein
LGGGVITPRPFAVIGDFCALVNPCALRGIIQALLGAALQQDEEQGG